MAKHPMSDTTTIAPIERLLPGLREAPPLQRHEFILCRFCHAPVTSRGEQLTIGESHQHHFINPHGLRFLIGCFRSAPGCDISGAPLQEYSWFRGYSWQLARCSDCGEHLGWFYQNGEADQFFGLIVDKLVRYQV